MHHFTRRCKACGSRHKQANAARRKMHYGSSTGTQHHEYSYPLSDTLVSHHVFKNRPPALPPPLPIFLQIAARKP